MQCNILKIMVLGVVLACGCAHGSGSSWAELYLDVKTHFSPEADRLHASGRLLTSTDYSVQINTLDVEFAPILVEFAPEASEDAHSHSHGGEGEVHTADDDHDDDDDHAGHSHDHGNEGGDAAIREIILAESCINDCQTRWQADALGELLHLRAFLHEVTLDLVIFDALEGSTPRLPSEGVKVKARVPLALIFNTDMDIDIERGKPARIDVLATFALPTELFDHIDWQALTAGYSGQTVDLSSDATLATLLTANIKQHSALNLDFGSFWDD